MLLVTGAAGFIGSNVVASLNEAGRTDIAVNDVLGTGQKWRNLAGRRLADFVPAGRICCAGSKGASSTPWCISAPFRQPRRRTVDLVIEANFRLPLRLFEWCASARTPFIYASSAATYGDGEAGFSDDWSRAALRGSSR